MEPKKIIFFILLFFLNNCFILQKKPETGSSVSDFPLLPEIIAEKKIYILPFENNSGEAEVDYILHSLPYLFYSYIRFVNTMPFQLEYASLKNEKPFFDYFGITEITPEIRKTYIEAAIELNRYRKEEEKKEEEKTLIPGVIGVQFSSLKNRDTVKGQVRLPVLTASPTSIVSVEFFENGKSLGIDNTFPYEWVWDTTRLTDGEHRISAKVTDAAGASATSELIVYVNNTGRGEETKKTTTTVSQVTLPDFFNLKVMHPSSDFKTLLKEECFWIKGELTKNKTLKLNVIDAFSQNILLEWEVSLFSIDFRAFNSEETIYAELRKTIQPFLEKLSGKKFYSIRLKKNPSDSIIYIDDQYIEEDVVLLAEGKHNVKAIKSGFEKIHAEFEVKQNAELPIIMNPIAKNTEVFIETEPAQSAVFVDGVFVGLSPVVVTLEKGVHHIRVSRGGFEHYNRMITVYSHEKRKDFRIVLEKEKLNREEEKRWVNQWKNIAFYSFFPLLGAHIYCEERSDTYREKVEKIYNQYTADASLYQFNELSNKYNFYSTASQFFKNASIVALVVASVFQVLELEMDDVGVGIDRDKNLSIYYQW